MRFLNAARFLLIGATVALLFTASPVRAQTVVSLASLANDDSVVIDYFSDAFGRINLDPDGFWQLSTSSHPNDPRIATPVTQYGTYTAFANDVNFQLGNLTYNNAGLTGSGTEVASITALTVDVFSNMDISFGEYDTVVDTFTGTVTLSNGALTAIDLQSDITIQYTGGPVPGMGFSGTFDVTGNQFDLFVDDTFSIGGFDIRHAWDADGTVLAVNTVSAAVPEPNTLLLASGVLGLLATCRRIRPAQKKEN